MNHLFVPYQESLELKELGFNEPCIYYFYGSDQLQAILRNGEPQWMNHNDSIFSTCYSAPTFSQAFRWFREKYNIMYTVDYNIASNTFHGSYTKIGSDYESNYTASFTTYEEAELACLRKLIQLIKDK